MKTLFFVFIICPFFYRSQYRKSFSILTPVFLISAGTDIRNAAYKGTMNDPGFDGIFRLGVGKENIQGGVFYEIFNIIEYKSLV
jgi:hypothetical protein